MSSECDAVGGVIAVGCYMVAGHCESEVRSLKEVLDLLAHRDD